MDDGKGESDPIAKEEGTPEEIRNARQRNRRVEISYKIKQPGAPSGTATSTSSEGPFPPTAGDVTSYGGLTWLEPGGRRLRMTRIGKPDPDNINGVAPTQSLVIGYGYRPGVPERVYAYYAPANPTAKTLTLDAGPFGTIPNVPIA